MRKTDELEKHLANVDDAAREGRDGKVWAGPNGSGEYWVIERAGRRLVVTATNAK